MPELFSNDRPALFILIVITSKFIRTLNHPYKCTENTTTSLCILWIGKQIEVFASKEAMTLAREGQMHICEGITAMLKSQQEVLEENVIYELSASQKLLLSQFKL